MRLMKEDSTYVDLEVEKGIQAGFYQELVKVDTENAQLHFLAPITKKIVATPDLDALFAF